MCEGVLLSHIVKVPGFKVPTQSFWEWIAQRPFKLGRVERLLTARAEPPKQSSSKKAHKKGPKQRGPRSSTDDAASDASEEAVAVPSKGDSDLHSKTWHQLNLFRPPWTCGQCERKVYLWCMHGEGCDFCLTTVECPMRGRIPLDEDAWLHCKWKADPDVDSPLQATLPPGPVEDEVDSYEAFVLAGRVSELSNTATPEQDAVVPVLATPSDVAKPLMAGSSEEEDSAILVAPARMATRRTPVDEPSLLLWEIG